MPQPPSITCSLSTTAPCPEELRIQNASARGRFMPFSASTRATTPFQWNGKPSTNAKSQMALRAPLPSSGEFIATALPRVVLWSSSVVVCDACCLLYKDPFIIQARRDERSKVDQESKNKPPRDDQIGQPNDLEVAHTTPCHHKENCRVSVRVWVLFMTRESYLGSRACNEALTHGRPDAPTRHELDILGHMTVSSTTLQWR